ncbi:MAG: GntR family transcriptional regulator [Leptolyngbyaceae cyanobacterium bins.349]|nr:GntR family transcriptional regulator [Leptolyngbyaceae cyanobacterium bins.349]
MCQIQRSLHRGQALKEQAYQALRAAILTGELSPGAALSETQLAKMFQVSRTPVREALRLLQYEELVAYSAHQGLHVATFSTRDAAELYDCRLGLERISVAAACTNASVAQLQELHHLVQQLEKLVMGKPSNLLNFQLLELDDQFHRLLAESSQNLQLQAILDQLLNKMLLLRIQTLQQNITVLNLRAEHRPVYEAVLQRNVTWAVEAMDQHLLAAKERVMQQMTRFQPSIEAT